MRDQNPRNLNIFLIFSVHLIASYNLLSGRGWWPLFFTFAPRVTPLTSAKGWRQRQNQHFVPAQPKNHFEKKAYTEFLYPTLQQDPRAIPVPGSYTGSANWARDTPARTRDLSGGWLMGYLVPVEGCLYPKTTSSTALRTLQSMSIARCHFSELIVKCLYFPPI